MKFGVKVRPGREVMRSLVLSERDPPRKAKTRSSGPMAVTSDGCPFIKQAPYKSAESLIKIWMTRPWRPADPRLMTDCSRMIKRLLAADVKTQFVKIAVLSSIR